MKEVFLLAACISFLTSCAAPSGNISRLGDGSYRLRQEDHAGIFGNMKGLKKSVNKEISDFAKNEGKELVLIGDREHPVGTTPADWAWYEVTFRLRDPKLEKDLQQACQKNLDKNPSLIIIADKIALGGAGAQSFLMLTNQEKPTEPERAAISIYADLRKKCNEIANKALIDNGAPSPILAVNHSTETAGDNLLVALYNKSISYGDYARFRKELMDNREQAIVKIEQEIRANAIESASRAQEIANQTAIAQAQISQANAAQTASTAMMMNAFKPVPQALNPIMPSRSLNCTSTNTGFSVRTICN